MAVILCKVVILDVSRWSQLGSRWTLRVRMKFCWSLKTNLNS